MKKINIDIVSDIACPWCYVGKKHIEKAMSEVKEFEFEVNWKPYQLDPTIPKEGIDRDTYLRNKFGSLERYDQLAERLKSAGRNAGIEFAEIKKAPNTLPLHHLLHEAGKEGFSNELKERFFQAYFLNETDLTEVSEIVKIMAEFRWSEEKTIAAIESEEIGYEVNAEIRYAQNVGVQGVPYFIINNKYGISGAQPPEVFVNALRDIGGKMPVETAEGASCAVDDPNC